MAPRIRRNRHLHPEREELVSWLDGGFGHYDEHIENCLWCMETIEAIESGSVDAGLVESAPISAALAEAVRPPADLRPRLRQEISKTLQARDDLTLLGDLLGVSWRTLRILSQGTGLNE